MDQQMTSSIVEGDVPPPPPLLLLTLAADDQGGVSTRFAPGVTPQQVAALLRGVANDLDPQQGSGEDAGN